MTMDTISNYSIGIALNQAFASVAQDTIAGQVWNQLRERCENFPNNG